MMLQKILWKFFFWKKILPKLILHSTVASFDAPQEVINRARAKGVWLSDDLICPLLRIELLKRMIVIGDHVESVLWVPCHRVALSTFHNVSFEYDVRKYRLLRINIESCISTQNIMKSAIIVFCLSLEAIKTVADWKDRTCLTFLMTSFLHIYSIMATRRHQKVD